MVDVQRRAFGAGGPHNTCALHVGRGRALLSPDWGRDLAPVMDGWENMGETGL